MYRSQFSPTQRDDILADADPAYLAALRRYVEQAWREAQAFDAEQQRSLLLDSLIPSALAGNIIDADGAAVYIGPLANHLDALVRAQTAQRRDARARRQRVRALVGLGVLAVLFVVLGVRAILSGDGESDRVAVALGEGRACSAAATAYGARARTDQPTALEIAAAARERPLLFCVVNIAPDRNSRLDSVPDRAALNESVAWLVDTTLRPVFGVSPDLFDVVAGGDTVSVRRGGQTLTYLLSAAYASDKQSAARTFDQTQPPGIVLFALDDGAGGGDAATVRVIEGRYQMPQAFPASHRAGETVTLAQAQVVIDGVTLVETADAVLASVSGRATGSAGTVLLVQLQNASGTFFIARDNGESVRLSDGETPLTITYAIPQAFAAALQPDSLALELRTTPTELPAYVVLDAVLPTLSAQLLDARWLPDADRTVGAGPTGGGTVTVTLQLSSAGQSVLDVGEVQVVQDGVTPRLTLDPPLPLTVDGQATLTLTFTPVSPTAPITVRLDGRDWAELTLPAASTN